MESSNLMATHTRQCLKRRQRQDIAMWWRPVCFILFLHGCHGGRARHQLKRHSRATDAVLVGIRSAMAQVKKSAIPNILLSSSSPPSVASTRFAVARRDERQLLEDTETAYLMRSQSQNSNQSTEENELQCLESMVVPCTRSSQHVSERGAQNNELDCLEKSLNRSPTKRLFTPSTLLSPRDDNDIAKVSVVSSSHGSLTRRSVYLNGAGRAATTMPAKSSNPDGAATTTSATAIVAAAAVAARPLVFWENMVCGAISRSIAQTVMHPANTMKTILQSSSQNSLGSLMQPSNFRRLTQGAGANFLLSVPHGAINFAVLELVRHKLQKVVNSVPVLKERAEAMGPGLDFLSSSISTICCSVVSTPQMMICDNIMAGNYQNLPEAVRGLFQQRGLMGFYAGWWPGLVGKIPSYALTWTLFQQLKKARFTLTQRPARNVENSIMGCIASATTVTIMIPMDTIKTRLVSQTGRAASSAVPYKGIIDCATRVLNEEGIGAFYRGLPPRLISVVPMIGIQFGVYEAMRRVMIKRAKQLQEQQEVDTAIKKELDRKCKNGVVNGGTTSIPMPQLEYGRQQVLEEALMEVAADENQPFPAPHFLIKARNGLTGNGNGKLKNKGNKQR